VTAPDFHGKGVGNPGWPDCCIEAIAALPAGNRKSTLNPSHDRYPHRRNQPEYTLGDSPPSSLAITLEPLRFSRRLNKKNKGSIPGKPIRIRIFEGIDVDRAFSLTLSYLRKNGGTVKDKILSARVDESVIQRISSLARRLNTSKKHVIENAVRDYARKIDQEENFDVFEQTSGAWRRKESASRIVEEARKAFRSSMERRRRRR
jgi:predicted transcriptional regulator